jgi:hypothetical protein
VDNSFEKSSWNAMASLLLHLFPFLKEAGRGRGNKVLLLHSQLHEDFKENNAKA